MDQKIKKKKSSQRMIWVASSAIAVFFILAGAFLVKILISDNGQKRKRQIQMVTLLKPPPPPKIKEKPPEPEIKKKEEVMEQKVDEPEPEEMPDEASDEAPPGEDLGLDGDGTAGSDGFGLRAKKGGRPLIGGGQGSKSLLRKYGWYTHILQEEIRKEVRKHLDQNGGIPEGKLTAIVRIVIDGQGVISDYAIVGSSGNHDMDKAVKAALGVARIEEPPPRGMPKALKLKISSKG